MTTEEALQDFRRRWENTYVWLKMKQHGIETLVYVRQVEQDLSKIGVLHLESANYGSITINLGSSDHSLLFRYPRSGVFQHGQYAAQYRRRPARQWRRGICTDNSTVISTTRALTGTRIGIDLASLQSAFNHKTFSKEGGLALLNEQKARSVALENNFSVSLSALKSSDYMIMYWDDLVACCDSKGQITALYEKVVEPELMEIFNGH